MFGATGADNQSQNSTANVSRRNEQEQIDTIKSLYRHPTFRLAIQGARILFSSTYWKQEKEFKRRARALEKELQIACKKVYDPGKPGCCSYSLQYPQLVLPFDFWAPWVLDAWGIPSNPLEAGAQEAITWLRWLVQHWNIDETEIPAVPRYIREPTLSGWTLSLLPHPLLYKNTPYKPPYFYALTTLTFYPGITLREARKAAEEAYKRLQRGYGGYVSRKARGGRPRLNERDHEALKKAFKKVGTPRPGQQILKIRQIAEILLSWGRPVSQSKIGIEYRSYLKQRGAEVRRYVTDSRDARI